MAIEKRNLLEMREEERLRKESGISTLIHDTRCDITSVETKYNAYLATQDDGRTSSAINIRTNLVKDVLCIEQALKLLKAKLKAL